MAWRMLALFDPVRISRRARIRIGKNFRVDGVPAILLGIACIVTAAGAGRVIEKAAPILPETLRETRELLRSLRPERKELTP
jgi:hypothetical protein